MAFDLLAAVFGDHQTAIAPRAEGRQYGAGNTEYWGLFGLLGLPQTTSGVPITPESALRVSTVIACVRLISETFAQLPLHYYERLPRNRRRLADDDPLAQVVIGSPNLWQTGFEFRELMQAHVDLRGNAYGLKIPGKSGAVSEIIPLHPDRMTIARLANGRLLYNFKMPDGSTEKYSQDEIFHVRNLSQDGVQGLSPIQMGRDAVGLSLAEETHAAGLFKNGAQPGVILKHPGKLLPERARVLREDWERLHSGPYNAHRTAVLEEGMDASSLSVSNVDMQYLEGRKFQGEEICRIFRVPPHMVGFLDRATFNNVVQLSMEFVNFSLFPRLRRWEEAMSRDFIEDPSRFYFKYDYGSLLKGDIETRFKAYATARQWGWYSIDDIRELEDMDPIGEEAGGNVYLSPMNMVPASFVEPTAQATLDQLTAPPPEPSPTAAETDQAKSEANVAKAEAQQKQRLIDQLVIQSTMLGHDKGSLSAQYDAMYARCEEADNRRQEAERLTVEAMQRAAAADGDKEQHAAALEAAQGHEGRASALAAELGALRAEADAIRQQRDSEAQERRTAESRLRDERQARESAERELGFSNPARQEVLDASRELVAESARRMVRWEAEGARRACKKPNFLDAVDEFIAEHEDRFCAAVDLPLKLHVQLTGRRCDPRQAVQRHLNQSKEQLLEAAGKATPETLSEHVERTVSAWESRASALADEWTK